MKKYLLSLLIAIIFIPIVDDGGIGGADINTSSGGFIPSTDGGGVGGGDISVHQKKIKKMKMIKNKRL